MAGSYADFITLMFAFFVVMYSVAIGNEGAYKQFSDSISIALTKKPLSDATSVVSNPEAQRLRRWWNRRTARLGEEQRKIQERMKGMATNLGPSHVADGGQGAGQYQTDAAWRGDRYQREHAVQHRRVHPATGYAGRIASGCTGLSMEELPIEVEGHTDDILSPRRSFRPTGSCLLAVPAAWSG